MQYLGHALVDSIYAKTEEGDASPVFSNVLETRKDPVPR